MIYTTNILVIPFLIVLWSIDLYLILAGARLILGRLRNPRAARLSSVLREFTDWMPQRVARWLSTRGRRPIASWIPWATVIVIGLVTRHLLVLAVMRIA